MRSRATTIKKGGIHYRWLSKEEKYPLFRNKIGLSVRTLISGMRPIYVSMSSTNVTITVDKELKKKMEELKQVNWSKVARTAFEEEIRREKRRQITNDIKAIREKDRSNWSGSEEVRKWRDVRA